MHASVARELMRIQEGQQQLLLQELREECAEDRKSVVSARQLWCLP